MNADSAAPPQPPATDEAWFTRADPDLPRELEEFARRQRPLRRILIVQRPEDLFTDGTTLSDEIRAKLGRNLLFSNGALRVTDGAEKCRA